MGGETARAAGLIIPKGVRPIRPQPLPRHCLLSVSAGLQMLQSAEMQERRLIWPRLSVASVPLQNRAGTTARSSGMSRNDWLRRGAIAWLIGGAAPAQADHAHHNEWPGPRLRQLTRTATIPPRYHAKGGCMGLRVNLGCGRSPVGRMGERRHRAAPGRRCRGRPRDLRTPRSIPRQRRVRIADVARTGAYRRHFGTDAECAGIARTGCPPNNISPTDRVMMPTRTRRIATRLHE